MKRFLAVSSAVAVSGENPVTKVVSLLGDMQTQMQKDAKADLAAFKKMECWCKTHREEKGEAVKKAQATIKQADDTIKEKTGQIAGLEEEIKGLKADIAAAQDDLKSAAALRQKEAKQAATEQADMKSTIEALTTALDILGKVQSGFIQTPTAFVQVKKTLEPFRSTLRSDLWSLMGKLDNASKLRGVQSQSNANGFLQQEPAAEEARDYSSGPVSPNAKKGGVAGVTSYSSNSGAIFGLLGQMKVDFETQLKDSLASEAAKTKGFQTLTAEKNKAIAFSKSEITAKQKELGTAKIDKANATTLKEQTTMDLTADQKFIVEMEAQCKDAVDGYGARSSERAEEMKAVGEAIAFLTSDEARDIFNKGFSFVQLGAQKHTSVQANKITLEAKKRASLIKVLLQTYRKSGGRRGQALALLAASSKLDAFVKVKEALDKLKAELQAEQKTEFETRDKCMGDLNTNEVSTKDKTVLLEDTEANVAELGAKIEATAAAIAEAEEEIAATNKMVAEATEDRKAENAVFKETVNDQELVIKVLKVAVSKLEGFYGKVALLQQTPGSAPPPPKQATFKRQQGGNGAIGLIKVIIQDAEHVIKISTADETKAQSEYEKAMADAKAELEALNTSVITKKDEKASLASQKEDQEAIASSTKEELLALGKENAALHGDCDFLLKNFDLRQEARTEEIESIEQAKQVLSGADFE